MHDELHILVVDDDAADRRLVRRAILARHPGAAVEEAETCAEAGAALATGRFDCAFLDFQLPDGDGLGCLHGAREAGIETPAILLTGHGDEMLAVEAIRAGATDYLNKHDLTPQLLDHCLRGALRYHEAQQKISRTQEVLRLRDRAIAAASNGIVICDPHQPDCPIIYCNPAFSALTGYPPAEAVGRNCRFLQGAETDPQDVQKVRDALRAEQDCLVILRNYKRDGTPFWNELTVSPVRDPRGHVTHYIGVQTDITERREAEEAVRRGLLRQQAFVRDMFSSVTGGRLILCATAADLPRRHAAFGEPVPLTPTGGIRALREQTVGACEAAGLPDERRYDLETAVGEAAMNAVVHAGGGLGRVFVHAQQGAVQVWVEDRGRGIAVEDLPNATLRRGYSSAGSLGYGFKLILMTTDRVHLLTGGEGTTAVLETERVPPEPLALFP